MRFPTATLFLLAATLDLPGQALDNSRLQGRWWFREIALAAREPRSAIGEITFNGAGGYQISGQRGIGMGAAENWSAAGAYRVRPSGIVELSDPLVTGATVNARLGQGMVIGSTTETPNTWTLFVAVPAGSSTTSDNLTGQWAAASLDLGSDLTRVRNTFFRLTIQPGSQLAPFTVNGQGMAYGPAPVTQSYLGGSLALTDPAGAGVMRFQISPTSAPALLGPQKQLLCSADRNVLILGEPAISHDLLIAIRMLPAGSGSNQTLQGLHVAANLRYESNQASSFSGAANLTGAGRAVWTQRLRHSAGVIDFTGLNAYGLSADGTGTLDLRRLAAGQGGYFLASAVSPADSNSYEILLGAKAVPAPTAAGPFLNPQGVVSAASFAPVGSPIAPGAFIALFGSGLASTTTVASGYPFPSALGGVQVLVNGAPAPVYVVSPTQINFLVPYATPSGTARLQVVTPSGRSNEVEVTVAATAPGVYSTAANGLGAGAILQANFTLVTPQNPARRGSAVLLYLTGLGAVTPAVADGAASSTSVLSRVNGPVKVYIGGREAAISFAGLAPGFAGLYQINAVVPAGITPGSAVPLAIETAEGFTDLVDIAVAP